MALSTLRRAVFLDRDGVINRNRPDYVRSWLEFKFEPSARTALARLAQTEFVILVVTNQSGVGRGYMSAQEVDDIHNRMTAEVAKVGGRIDRVYYCPHAPKAACACRKPLPGMLVQASEEFQLDLSASYLVGDWVDDVRAARAAGTLPLLVQTGRGQEALEFMRAQEIELPTVVADLGAGVDWILEHAAVEALLK